MEQHDQDPTGNDTHADDAWRQAAERWNAVSEKIKTHYQDLVGDEGPSEEKVREAVSTLGTAAQSMIDSLGEAMRDPEVRGQVKDAAASFVAALGTTFSRLGDELRGERRHDLDEEE